MSNHENLTEDNEYVNLLEVVNSNFEKLQISGKREVKNLEDISQIVAVNNGKQGAVRSLQSSTSSLSSFGESLAKQTISENLQAAPSKRSTGSSNNMKIVKQEEEEGMTQIASQIASQIALVDDGDVSNFTTSNVHEVKDDKKIQVMVQQDKRIAPASTVAASDGASLSEQVASHAPQQQVFKPSGPAAKFIGTSVIDRKRTVGYSIATPTVRMRVNIAEYKPTVQLEQQQQQQQKLEQKLEQSLTATTATATEEEKVVHSFVPVKLYENHLAQLQQQEKRASQQTLKRVEGTGVNSHQAPTSPPPQPQPKRPKPHPRPRKQEQTVKKSLFKREQQQTGQHNSTGAQAGMAMSSAVGKQAARRKLQEAAHHNVDSMQLSQEHNALIAQFTTTLNKIVGQAQLQVGTATSQYHDLLKVRKTEY